MELISLQGKTNFFEKRVGEYQKAGVMAGAGGAAEQEAGRGFFLLPILCKRPFSGFLSF